MNQSFNPIVQGHSNAMVSNVFNQLKSGTSRLHVRLERAVDIMDEVLTRARYANLISDFHAFYAPLEDQIFFAVNGAGLRSISNRAGNCRCWSVI